MSSADEQTDRVSKLIERLLLDPELRGEFRRDPVQTCRASGLDDLADELGAGGKAMHTLEMRESKSSLAGVVMAVAAEAVGVAELSGMLGHGLHGPARAAAIKAPTAGGVKTPQGGAAKAAGLHGARGAGASGKGAHAVLTTAAAGGPAGSAVGSPASGAAASPDAGGARALATAAARPAGTGAALPPAGAAAAAPGEAGTAAAAPGGAAPGAVDAASSSGGGGGYVATSPGGAAAVPGGGSGSAAIAQLLSNPRLSLPPGARTLFASGSVDPRLASVLASAVDHHSIVVGDVESVVDPLHAQAFDIVSVDGQPVGPGNVAARDLITEIAALDPSVRPSEIGTPWPIQSSGFFTDASHADRLHFAFVSQADYQPPGAGAGAAGEGSAAGDADAANGGPVAATPAAAGVAQAADAALAGGSTAPSSAPLADQAAASSPAGGVPASGVANPGAGAAAAAHVVPTPEGDPNYASAKAHAAFETAKRELGVRYQWGGTSPSSGFDCSGLMQWAYGKVGVSLPRVAADQFHVGMRVDLGHLREGDLVFFQDSTGYIHHVGMYVGNHKFLEAPHTGDVVRYADLREPYWAQQFAGGRRIVPLASQPAAVMPGASDVAAAPEVVAAVSGAAVSPAPVPAALAPKPGTAVFKALQRQEHSFHRHTVQFMAAVQPAPYSPLYGQSPGAPVEPAPPPRSPLAPALDAALAGLGSSAYPGDNAPKNAIAQWMATVAQQHGLPRELPVMAALVESSLHNDPGGDRDSVGYFQMRVGIWNNGRYAGYPNNSALQLKWFIDHALEVKNARLASDPSFAHDPNAYGEWIADIERPAAQYRYRYQLQLGEARALLGER